MPQEKSYPRVSIENLRWRLDPATLSFETTQDLQPLKEIIGQKRGVEAFRFGIDMDKPGYNVFVTGTAGSGRMATVRRLLEDMSKKDVTPEDLCYVNCFKDPESPILIVLPGGTGSTFKRDVKSLVDQLKKEIPQLFESQEYMNMKKEITDTYETQAGNFFKSLEKRVKEEGFVIVDIQMGQFKRPEVMPVVDDKPISIDQLEALVEKARFPKEEYEVLKEKQIALRQQIEQIFLELRDLQKEVHENIEKMDRAIFMKTATDLAQPLFEKYKTKKVQQYFQEMLEDMADNLKIFSPQSPVQLPGLPAIMPDVDLFQPYDVNLLVDNSQRKSPPVIIEGYPTYRNIFGAIERVVDRGGVWRTDYSKIKAGSLVKANGGFLVINLKDAIVEPGVWQALKRALKSKKLEIQTFDPMY
ncbi:MAG: ATP-binding protein, partial [Desulfobacterales bacterium]